MNAIKARNADLAEAEMTAHLVDTNDRLENAIQGLSWRVNGDSAPKPKAKDD